MTNSAQPILLGSIALEPNRWKPAGQRVPSLRVSDWSSRAAQSGFDGWELWEDHYFMADDAERSALRAGPLPVRVFNTYLIPGIDDEAAWLRVADAVRSLGPQVRGVKFNLGKDPATAAAQVVAARDWASELPPHVRMLCECHGGTILETLEAAARAFEEWPAGRFAAIIHPMTLDSAARSAWLAALPGRVAHLHWQARDRDNRVSALDARPERLAEAVAALQAAGFFGSHTIEFVEGTSRPGENPPDLFAAAARNRAVLAAALA